MPGISIIGVGRVGGALAIALTDAGYTIENLIHRRSDIAHRISSRLSPKTSVSSISSFPQIDSEVVVITTGDPDIEPAASMLAKRLRNKPAVLHTSGSLASDVLSDLAALGCPTGSMHPLVSISDPISGATSFSGAYFCIEGDPGARDVADGIVEALGGRPFTIKSEYKPLYHAAAVTACGHLVALIDAAIEMLAACEIEPEDAKRILLPLVRSTIENLENQTPALALTGTFARADVGAFQRHLTSMDATSLSAVREIYLELGARSLDLAAANGTDPENIAKLRNGISIAKRKTG